jgi:polyisoprenoid-binding protein YceI
MSVDVGTGRAVAGRTLPAAGRWVIDPAHSRVGFSVRHATVTTVHGRFPEFSGAVDVGPTWEESSVSVSVRTASFTTAMPVRDADVRGAEWLDAERFPVMEFRSTSVRSDGLDLAIDGELTVHGVTRPIVLTGEFVGTARTPQGEVRAGFTATTGIDRRDFGIARNVPLATGGFFVSHRVGITLDVSAVSAVAAVDGGPPAHP